MSDTVEAPTIPAVTLTVPFIPPTPLTLAELRAKITPALTVLNSDLSKPLAAISGAAKIIKLTGYDITPLISVLTTGVTVAQGALPAVNEIVADDQIMDGVLWITNLVRTAVAKFEANKAA